MPKINVQKPFDFAVDGLHVVTIEVGEQEVSERCAEVAIEHLKVATGLQNKDKNPIVADSYVLVRGTKEGKTEALHP